MKGTLKAVQRAMKVSAFCVTGAILATSAQASAQKPNLTPDNPIQARGIVEQVVDANNYIIKLDDASLYQSLRAKAGGNTGRLSHFDSDKQAVHVRLPNISAPTATNAGSAVKTLRGMQIAASTRNFAEGDEAIVDCFGWDEDGYPMCGIINKTDDDTWVDIGAWLIYRGYSEYVTTKGINPRHHDIYLRYSRRHQ